jgi:hypothetical protein
VGEPINRGSIEFRQVVLQPCDNVQPLVTEHVEEWRHREFGIGNDVIQKSPAQMFDYPLHQTLPSGVLTVFGPIGLHIQGESRPGPHYGREAQLVGGVPGVPGCPLPRARPSLILEGAGPERLGCS